MYMRNGKISLPHAIGQLRRPSLRIYADSLIENLQEQSDERCGEASEAFLDDVTKEQEGSRREIKRSFKRVAY